MNREIKVIKRAVRREDVLSHACNKPEAATPRELAKTIGEWVKMHKQRASEELLAARAFRAALP